MLLSPLVGHLFDRYNTKKICIAGCSAPVAGLLLSSQVSALWLLYISFGMILAVGPYILYCDFGEIKGATRVSFLSPDPL